MPPFFLVSLGLLREGCLQLGAVVEDNNSLEEKDQSCEGLHRLRVFNQAFVLPVFESAIREIANMLTNAAKV